MAPHRVFLSYHYERDRHRADLVRKVCNIRGSEGNRPATSEQWKGVLDRGLQGISEWTTDALEGRTCTLVLVGNRTAGRPLINYEIRKSWALKIGVAGIRVHGLDDEYGNTDDPGDDPFVPVRVGGRSLGSLVQCHEPAGESSAERLAWIRSNLTRIVKSAIRTRATVASGAAVQSPKGHVEFPS